MLTFDVVWHFGDVFSSRMNPGFQCTGQMADSVYGAVWVSGCLIASLLDKVRTRLIGFLNRFNKPNCPKRTSLWKLIRLCITTGRWRPGNTGLKNTGENKIINRTQLQLMELNRDQTRTGKPNMDMREKPGQGRHKDKTGP